MQNLILQAHRIGYALVRAIAIEFAVGEVTEHHLPGGRIKETTTFDVAGNAVQFTHPLTKWRV